MKRHFVKIKRRFSEINRRFIFANRRFGKNKHDIGQKTTIYDKLKG